VLVRLRFFPRKVNAFRVAKGFLPISDVLMLSNSTIFRGRPKAVNAPCPPRERRLLRECHQKIYSSQQTHQISRTGEELTSRSAKRSSAVVASVSSKIRPVVVLDVSKQATRGPLVIWLYLLKSILPDTKKVSTTAWSGYPNYLRIVACRRT
jgi:hypothetical protein